MTLALAACLPVSFLVRQYGDRTDGTSVDCASTKNQTRLKEKSRSSSSLPPVRQLYPVGFRKGKIGWLLLPMGLLVSRRGRVSSSASWMHSGRRGAVKLAARLQNTLTYYHRVLGGNFICGTTRANELPLLEVKRT
jgi:hypothetical protein